MKTCPNGHHYDTDTYGEECPICPSAGGDTQNFQAPMNDYTSPTVPGDMGATPPPIPDFVNNAYDGDADRTQVTNPINGGGAAGAGFSEGETQVTKSPYGNGGEAAGYSGEMTQVGHVPTNVGKPDPNGGRRIVGALVTYTAKWTGSMYPIYEGNNTVGRRSTNHIFLMSDPRISGEHLTILKQPKVDKVFIKDNGSSTGTLVNGEPLFPDQFKELNHNDIITIGDTKLLFMRVPVEFIKETTEQ